VIPVVAHHRDGAAASLSQVALSTVIAKPSPIAAYSIAAQTPEGTPWLHGAGPARPRSATARMRTLVCRVDATTMAHRIEACQ
jgi:hypothetical protein